MRPNKRVLLVSGTYNSLGGSRINKFVKYLPSQGWQVTILCNRFEGGWSSSDASSRVIVSRGLPSFSFLNRHFGCRRLGWMLDRMVFVPDKTVAWAIVAAWFACRLARRNEIDAVLTTSPRESAHLVGWAVQRFGVPWVADFRDLWTHRTAVYQPPTALHDSLCRKLERLFYERCDVLLANTPGNREVILEDFCVDPHRVIVVPNGYDPDDFKPLHRRCPDPPMVFGYMGGLDKPAYPWRDMFRAFEAVNAAGLPVVLRVQGRVSAGVSQAVQQLRYDCVQLYPNVPHGAAVAQLQGCDAAMVILADLGYTRNQVPMKLYQYLGAGLPVLAVVPENGCAADVVRRCSAGHVAAPGQWNRVQSVIKQMYQEWQDGKLTGAKPEAADRYSHRRLVSQLAAILDQITGTSPRQEERDYLTAKT